jgi:hypothetical protein
MSGAHHEEQMMAASPSLGPGSHTQKSFGWNYKTAEKHRWLIFIREKYCFN